MLINQQNMIQRERVKTLQFSGRSGRLIRKLVMVHSVSSCYRPQTKLRQGNVFTPACDYVRGEGGRSLSKGVSVWGGLSPGGSLSSKGGFCLGGGSLCSGESLSGGLSRGSLFRGVSVQGVGLCLGGGSLPRGGISVQAPPQGNLLECILVF